jgi:hypothetical protein
MEGVRNAYTILIEEFEGNRPLKRSGLRREEYIKIDISKIGWKGLGWIQLA